jgi:hypothetical protein
LIPSPRSQKEPKLARARQIPEWELYDGKIARFTRKLVDEGRIHASAAAADVNELAKVGERTITAYHWSTFASTRGISVTLPDFPVDLDAALLMSRQSE